MKIMQLVGLSILILSVAFLFQPSLDGGRSPLMSDPGPTGTAAPQTGVLDSAPVRTPTPAAVPSPAPIRRGAIVASASRNPLPTLTPPNTPAPPPALSVTPTLASLQVGTHKPARNAFLSDLHAPLVITFNRQPLDTDPSLTITPTVQGQAEWFDDRTWVFIPEPGWAPNTRYDVRVGDEWRTWFRTQRGIQSLSPSPSNAVSPHTHIAIEFGVLVDQTSVESAFNLSPTVAGSWRWTDERRFIFEPDQPLDYVTTYRVRLDGELRDFAGMPLPDLVDWSFTTRSALVSAKPSGSTGVESPLQLKFDTPMNPESVEAALSITPTVAGSFQWQGNTLIFVPEDFWDPYTTYHVNLSAASRATTGQTILAQDYGWQFSTGSVPHTVDFGYGPNIQVLDAAGRRAVQMEIYGARQATLRLYALSVPQFLDRYTSSFRGIGPGEEKPLKTGDLSLVLTWEQALESPAEAIIPSAVPVGLYVLETQIGPGRDHLIVVLAHHTLVLKQAERQLVTWASTMADHAPAANMHLRFYDRDGTLVAEGATEGRGLHRMVVPVDTDPLIVIGELDGDITVGGLGDEWKVGWSWWGWWKSSPSAPDATIYPYTDRPIYRPGQTVHARAVLRHDNDAVYRLPDGAEAVLRLRDARDNVIATRQLTVDEFGAVYADFEIADGGTVGTYHLEVSALGETARQPFLVEAYRKPDYDVTLTAATAHAVAGEPLTLTVQANYFFGPPVANARVELLPYVAGYDQWPGGEPALNYGYAYEKLRQAGRTDANGRFTAVLPAEITNGWEQQTWNVEATVTDASELSVSGHTRVVVHHAAVGLSLHTENFHYQPGEPIPVPLLVRDHHGTAQAGVQLSVGLYAWERKTGEYSRVVVETETTTGFGGLAEAVLQTSRPGWYQIRGEGTDAAGRQVKATGWVWVYDAGSVWGMDSSNELRLSTDRAQYAPGDAVSLLIESPVSGPALLSFERGTTRRETVIHLDAGMNALEFELLPDDVPNVYVAVAVWRTTPDDDLWRWQSRPEEELLTARHEILVPADHQQLTVSITPDRAQYAPRDQAVFLVEIRDSAGQPVRAGFSLALVDEAIFSLAADRTPDIFDAFYQPRPDIVRTYHSLRPTRWLDGGMGGGGGGGEAAGGNPRSDFPDTAFWAPALFTGADGVARVNVPLPDSLTSWRAVVRAVTADTKVGQATRDITVALPLSVQPVLPRFLVQGDRATLTAVVHNHTGLTQTATVQLTPTGLALENALSATQQVTLPASGTAVVGWTVIAERLGEASIRVDVALNDEGGSEWHDAILLPLPVLPLAVPQVDTVAAEVEGEWVEIIALPDAAIPDITRWELALAPSIATGMLDGLEYLIDYPFG